MRNIFFFEPNLIPAGVASTARKGDSWFNDVDVGDVVRMQEVGTKSLVGYATVVVKELVTYNDVLENAEHSQFARSMGRLRGFDKLWATLFKAYGNLESTEPFTILHLLPLQNVIDITDIDNVAERTAQKNKIADALSFASEKIVELLAAGGRAANIARDNYAVATHLAEENAALKAPGEQEANHIMDVSVAAAAAHIAAEEQGAFIRAVEQVEVIGEVETVLRVEF